MTMIPENRLREEISYTITDLERVCKVLEVVGMLMPQAKSNPYWTSALQDLANAKSRIYNIQTAMATPDPAVSVDLPAAAPAPSPLI